MELLQMLLIAWAAVTVVLVGALIYRGRLENREEDQIFLDPAENAMATEQRVIVARIERLGRPITALWVLSGGLLVVIAGLWLYRGFQNF